MAGIIILNSMLFATNLSYNANSSLSTVMELSLPKKSCVHYIGDDNVIMSYLWMTNISFINNVHMDLTVCKATSYVVAYQNRSALENLFTNVYLMQPHNRVLVVCPDYTCRGVGLENAKYHALDVIAIDNPYNIWFVTTNKFKAIHDLNTSDFILNDWVPVFDKNITILVIPFKPYASYDKTSGFGGFETRIAKYITKDWPADYILYGENDWTIAYRHMTERVGNVSYGGYFESPLSNNGVHDATISYAHAQSVLLVPKPHMYPLVTFVVQPMQFRLWIFITVATVVVAGIVKYFNKEGIGFTLYAMLLLNSSQCKSRKKQIKLLLLMWSLLALLLTTAYSAGLSSILTKPQLQAQLDSFQDVAAEGLVCYVGRLIRLFMHFSINKHLNDIAKRAITPLLNSTVTKHCIESERLFDDYLSPHYAPNTPLMMLKERLQGNYGVMILNYNSPLTKMFNKRLFTLREVGIIRAWFEMEKYNQYPNLKHMADYFNARTELPTDWSVIRFEHMQGVFYFWGVGCLVAIARFVYEIRCPAIICCQK